jgi:protein-disulfide isomerase
MKFVFISGLKKPMSRLLFFGLVFAANLAVSSVASAQFSTTSAIEKIIEEYLFKNPQVIQQSLALQQQRAERAEAARAAENLKNKGQEIFGNTVDMVIGNPSGDVTIVEFFDFRCGYCKRAHSVLKALLEEDKNIRVVLKQLPILGAESIRATQAALAAAKQNRYTDFHNKLFELEQINGQSIDEVVTLLGLDKKQFDRDFADQNVWSPAVSSSSLLASELGVNGTPAFIVGTSLVPGAVDLGSLKNLVALARAAKLKQ